MTPLYFPFNFVAETTAVRLGRWFDRVALLTPSAGPRNLSLAQGLEPEAWQIHCPPPGDEAVLSHLEADLRQWADVHAGTDLSAVLAGRDEQSPFAALPAVNRLRHQIRAGLLSGETTPVCKPNPLLTARVFLRLAQGLDRERAAIGDQLGALAAIEGEMIAQLQGQSADSNPPVPSRADDREDPGAFLTERRLAAWGRLALCIDFKPEVLVTDSPAVIAALNDRLPGFGRRRDLVTETTAASDPSGPRRLADAIARAASPETPAAPVQTVDPLEPPPGAAVFSVGMGPDDFCRHLAAGHGSRNHIASQDGRCVIVWIGHWPGQTLPPTDSLPQRGSGSGFNM